MSADAHPVPAHRGFAPDPVLLARTIDEQPPTAWVAASPETVSLGGQRQHRRQEVVGDAVPAARCRTHRSVRAQAEAHTPERYVDLGSPHVHVDLRVVGKGADRVTQQAQPGKLPLCGWPAEIRDSVGRQELDGTRGCVEMVMRRFGVARTPTVVGTGPMQAVGQPERGIRPERPCNGLHRR